MVCGGGDSECDCGGGDGECDCGGGDGVWWW